MPEPSCKRCHASLAPDTESCPACGLKNPVARCRACQELLMPGTLKCPHCKAKAPLLSRRLMLFRSFFLPAAIVILVSILSLLR